MKDHMSLTRMVGAAVTRHAGAPLPPNVALEARRTLLNVLGTTVGAIRNPAVDLIVQHGREYGGQATATIPGRTERLDAYHAAMAVGVAGHIDDFDDTHLETVIHPGASTLAATLATAATADPTGEQFLRAFALGCETQLLVGSAMSPSHYEAGWHITGTCGAIGAAVAAGLLMQLDQGQLTNAIAIGATQMLGVREAFGTMTKAYHVGKAAANGVVAAQLAQGGFVGTPDPLGHPQGFFAVLADESDPYRVIDNWGERWKLLSNTYKPYPCGIVIHPAIDCAIALHSEVAGGGTSIEQVVVHCHPLVVELTGNANPSDGIEARFSAAHGVAAGLQFGHVTLAEYEDGVVTDPDITLLRNKTTLVTNDRLSLDAARVEVVTLGGRRHTQMVTHARGSVANPMTDKELEGKIRKLVGTRLADLGDGLILAVSEIADRPNTAALLNALKPHDTEMPVLA